jgi:hypothetical protein
MHMKRLQLIMYFYYSFFLKLFSTEASNILVTQELKSSPSSLIVNVSKSHTNTHQGGNLLKDCSVLRRRRYLHNTNKHQIPTSMPSVLFEPAFPAFKRLQTCALDRTAPGIGEVSTGSLIIHKKNCDCETIN